MLLLFMIFSYLIILNFQYYLAHRHHQSHAEPSVPPMDVSGYMPQHNQSHAQFIYQSEGFSRSMPQGCEHNFQTSGVSSYMP